MFLATHFGNKLLRCEGVANQWIRISLVGTVSKRSAIGAVVTCVSGVVLTEGEETGASGSVTAHVGGGLTLGVHPVPATGTCFLELDFPDGPVRIAVIDLFGRVV